MFEQYLSKPLHLFLASALIALFAALFYPYLMLASLAVLYFFLLIRYGKKAFLFFLILGYMVTSSDINPALRATVNIGGLLGLLFLFFQKFGTDTKSYPLPHKYISQFILFILVSTLISSLLSNNISLCLGINLRQLSFFIICYLFYSLIENEEYLFLYLNAIITSGFILALSIVYDFYKNGFVLFFAADAEINRFTGYFGNINAAGLIIAISIIVCISFLFLPKYQNKYYKAGYLSVLFIMLTGIFLTNSRGAILGMITGSVFVLIKQKPLFMKKAIIGLLVILVFILTFTNVGNIVAAYFRVSSLLDTRDSFWNISMNIIKDNPIFGVGPEMSRFYVDKYFPVPFKSFEATQIRFVQSNPMFGLAHNFYLSRFAELGLPGIFSIIFIIALFTYFSIKLLNQHLRKNKNLAGIVIGIMGVGVGLFFRSFIESTGIISYGWIMMDIPFWLCFICLVYLFPNVNHT
jgi:O-antigen ligase